MDRNFKILLILVGVFETIKGQATTFCAKKYSCDPNSKYRTLDGTCNNLLKPWYGSTNTPFKRIFSGLYDDDKGSIRTKSTLPGVTLPNPRTVTIKVHNTTERDGPLTMIGVIFGQMITHDLVQSLPSTDSNGSSLLCGFSRTSSNAECQLIPTPSDDGLNIDQPFMAMTRTRSVFMDYNCKESSREQINAMTHWLDLSVIYGVDEKSSNDLRSMNDGLFKISRVRNFTKEFLPFAQAGTCPFPSSTTPCFRSGESRVNENMILASLQTIWFREHNRVAREIKNLRPTWNDEKLFQEARRIVIAEYQNIIYNEWLPLIVGPNLTAKHFLQETRGSSLGLFDRDIDPFLYNEFAASAFRFGHSMVKSAVLKKDEQNKVIDSFNLGDIIFNPTEAHKNLGLDAICRGAISERGLICSTSFSNTLINRLFENPHNTTIMRRTSLVTLNINRGRDHGIRPYNNYREYCGFKVALDFNDLDNMLPESIEILKNVYAHVDDIDFYTGGLSEKIIEGGFVGPTFACIIAKQFEELKYGDRFFVENIGSGFSESQLKEIRKVKFARILCDNLDIATIPSSAFLPISSDNQQISCNQIDSIDFKRMFMYD